jgi:hypothetical protein
MAWTNIGKQRMFETWFEGSGAPSEFNLMAATSAVAFSASTVYVSSIFQVSSGGGYPVSGLVVDRTGASGFVVTVSATGVENYAIADLTGLYRLSATTVAGIQDVNVIMLTDGFDGPAAGREIYAYWDTGSDVDVGNNSTLTINTASLKGT